MKFLRILMVGVALLVGGCVQLKKPSVTSVSKLGVSREISIDELQKRDKIWYVKGETEPFNGTSISYRDDGSKAIETPYVDGEEHGMVIKYGEDGWKHEIPYVNGKRHGTLIWYKEDGSKKGEVSYMNGIKHGTMIEYYLDGSKWVETPFVDGKLHGTVIVYREDGSKSSERPFVYGKLHGKYIEYDKDGSKSAEYVYENGEEISDK